MDVAHPSAVHVFEDDGSVVWEVLVVPECEWVDVEFEVALDSGSIVHVCRDSDTPGYDLQDSAGSRRGQNVLVGNGGTMPNLGEKRLSMQVPNGASDTSMIASVFQNAQVTRPLTSVGRVCDEGFEVLFTGDTATVRDKAGVSVCTFQEQNGGLYVAEMVLKLSFDRPE